MRDTERRDLLELADRSLETGTGFSGGRRLGGIEIYASVFLEALDRESYSGAEELLEHVRGVEEDAVGDVLDTARSLHKLDYREHARAARDIGCERFAGTLDKYISSD